MRSFGMLLRIARVLLTFGVIALAVVLGSCLVRLCSILVVFSRLLMILMCHCFLAIFAVDSATNKTRPNCGGKVIEKIIYPLTRSTLTVRFS